MSAVSSRRPAQRPARRRARAALRQRLRRRPPAPAARPDAGGGASLLRADRAGRRGGRDHRIRSGSAAALGARGMPAPVSGTPDRSAPADRAAGRLGGATAHRPLRPHAAARAASRGAPRGWPPPSPRRARSAACAEPPPPWRALGLSGSSMVVRALRGSIPAGPRCSTESPARPPRRSAASSSRSRRSRAAHGASVHGEAVHRRRQPIRSVVHCRPVVAASSLVSTSPEEHLAASPTSMRRLTLSVNAASAPTGSCRATPRSRAKVVGPFRRRLDGHRAVAAGLQDDATNAERVRLVAQLHPRRRAASRARVDEQGRALRRIDRPPASRPPSAAVTVRRQLRPACSRRSP